MVSSKAKTVDAFLQEHDLEERKVLETIRKTIRSEIPSGGESMEHGMPLVREGNEYWGYTRQKHYYAVYFSDFKIVARLAKRFPQLDCGKSCVRFRDLEQFPQARLAAAIRASRRS